MAAYIHPYTNLVSPPPSAYSENSDVPERNSRPPLPLANGLQPLSCLRCAHSKVRCDRLNPCSKCIKHDVLCEFPPPKTEKRKRGRQPVVSSSSSSLSMNNLYARLNHYEEVLRGLGVHVEHVNISNSPRARGAADSPKCDSCVGDAYSHQQKLIDGAGSDLFVVNGKRNRHIEGKSWNKMGNGLNNGTTLLMSPTDEDEDTGFGIRVQNETGVGGLALGLSPGSARTEDLYPPEQHISILWQTYLYNIQPITMLLHAPSISVILTEAARGHGHASNDVEALLFAVLACALMSITDAECMRKLNEKRSMLLSKYRSGCELALIKARFLMSSNFTLLQAYVIYLFLVSPVVDHRELWNLTGIARRNAERLNLHQERSTTGLTPFEVEMRRRLWNQIVMYDATPAGLYDSEFNYGITVPSNVNDSDLSPTMKEPPKERTGATEMIFCNLRYKVKKFMSQLNSGRKQWAIPGEKCTFEVERSYRANREKVIEEMEKEIELDLLRYCDTLNPVQLLTTMVARLTLCKLRFKMYQSSQNNKNLDDFTADDREFMFATALRVLEYENNAHTQPSIHGFLWHIDQDLQWSCLLHVLEDLKTRPDNEQAEKAWEQIHMSYEFRPVLYQGQNQQLPLYTTINRTTVEAWQAREINASKYGQAFVIPAYITMLKEQEQRASSKRQAWNAQPLSAVSSSQTSKHQADGGLSQSANFDQEIGNRTGNLNKAGAYPGDMDVNFFDPIANLRQEIPMSIQNYNNNPNQALDFLPPLTWTGQNGETW